jgi:hypothetical protein
VAEPERGVALVVLSWAAVKPSGQPKSRFACFRLPLMSNVRPHNNRERSTMRHLQTVLLAATLVALSGCTIRSISDSGYEGAGRYGRSSGLYQGELLEFDVLGVEKSSVPSDSEISLALDRRQPGTLRRGSNLLLVLSGAIIPDESMTKAASKYYVVGVSTGVPSNSNIYARSAGTSAPAPESYSRSLRLAAAQGGYEKLVVYWGLLESARENLGTSAVSWVPVVGWVLPDERQCMRIRLKITIIDVRTGQWEMFIPEPFEDKGVSSILSRREADQVQVSLLKEKAYAQAADELFTRYNR